VRSTSICLVLRLFDSKFHQETPLRVCYIDSNNPQHDPVVVWFNGGPGCSSLLALFQEHGPFVIDDGEYYIKNNPYPWNQRANVLYIESPAGVGYSVGDYPNDRIHNDMT
jgi:carboxypeptidase C (cathepsin A)